ncbi:MAG TPA: YpdA family putative bacillithiol disulfide reductase [Spirochaetes bacterium]|nr:YpdA family putative bacillithiol disulfide reductase [Spirochaetota bacterium]
MYDLIIIGSGPSGLSCGLAAHKAGLNYLILEKGYITNSIYNYPISMVFFTTRELIEIGDYPLTIVNAKPTREEALRYYARFVSDHAIKINTYEEVLSVEGQNGHFKVSTKIPSGQTNKYGTKKIIFATGVFDNPQMLNVPGEDLSKVSHYYKEAHPYVGKKVLVVGGRNSSAESALDLYRSGAEVTLAVREDAFSHLKYWVKPDLLNRIKEGSIQCHYRSLVKEIRDYDVDLNIEDGSTLTLENEFVLALTGFKPNGKLLRGLGVQIRDEDLKPEHDPETLETNVAGVYIAGVITAGMESSLVFIENGRFHGGKIVPHIIEALN